MSESLVYKAKSEIIVCHDKFQSGFGIFASKNIKKNDYICSLSGFLIDWTEAVYIDPTYIVSWQLGKGYKLVGDDLEGDLHIFFNLFL